MRGGTSKVATIGSSKDTTRRGDKIDMWLEITTIGLAQIKDTKKETIMKEDNIIIIITIIKVHTFLKRNF